MVKITNHVQRAIALLAGQFQQSLVDGEYNRFQRLIRAFVTSMQEIDNVDQDLKNNRSIDTSIGAQLDGLGQILGITRLPNESDDDYRERLKFQIYINKGNATPEEINKCFESGVDDYISKPFIPEELFRKMAQLIQKTRG